MDWCAACMRAPCTRWSPGAWAAARQGFAVVQVADDGDVADEVGVAHHGGQEVVAVVRGQRLALQHFRLLLADRCYDGHLRARSIMFPMAGTMIAQGAHGAYAPPLVTGGAAGLAAGRQRMMYTRTIGTQPGEPPRLKMDKLEKRSVQCK